MLLSLKRYLMNSLKLLAIYAFIGVIGLLMCFVHNSDVEVFLAIAIPAASLLLLLPAGYYFVMFLVYKKKCMNFTPVEGVIANWEIGLFRHTGCVIVNVDGKEYSSPSYFSYYDCKELVGKTISYAIIDETLFIYEVKDWC